MSQTQLNLPVLSEEENALVDRFVERSQDIVPGVEVTLAKRILRPGSNRVVCLAARTSVPINDDELASVSDLALRLSDGTNVVLSLSFFNDTVCGETIPFVRSTYNPNRYAMRSDSKLGIVLFATCLAALAGVYSFITGPFGKYLQTKPLAKSVSAAVSTALIKTVPIHPGNSAAKIISIIPANASSSRPVSEVNKTSAREINGNVRRVKEKHSVNRRKVSAYFEQLPKDEMLVPPPPATYVSPYGLPVQVFDQIPGLKELSKVVKPSAKLEANVSRPINKAEQKESAATIKPESKKTAKNSKSEARVTDAASTPEFKANASVGPSESNVIGPDSKAEAKSIAPVSKPEIKSSISIGKPEPKSVLTTVQSQPKSGMPIMRSETHPLSNGASFNLEKPIQVPYSSAPLPGDSSATQSLERIVPPNR